MGFSTCKAYVKEFVPITGRCFWLNIKQATDEPTIRELQLFAVEQ